jgi:hypothetical protein
MESHSALVLPFRICLDIIYSGTVPTRGKDNYCGDELEKMAAVVTNAWMPLHTEKTNYSNFDF